MVVSSIAVVTTAVSAIAVAVVSVGVGSSFGVGFALLSFGFHGSIGVSLRGFNGAVGAVLGDQVLALIHVGNFNGLVDDIFALLLYLGGALLDSDGLLLYGAVGDVVGHGHNMAVAIAVVSVGIGSGVGVGKRVRFGVGSGGSKGHSQGRRGTTPLR